jgi:hypothetical protein
MDEGLRMKSGMLSAVAILLLLHPSVRAQLQPPASKRFAAAEGMEMPSFQRHVLPLMSRLGCNGRACHGSFQGQGGFRLSLFGYDFKADHDALLTGKTPRVDLKQPAQSLALQKPTRSVPHKGGKRLEVGGWEYHLLIRWINTGAPSVKAGDSEFTSLHVEPREIVFEKAGQSRQIKVTARWSDGSVEDVTPLCRFRSNDESVAAVNEDGLVTAQGKGGTDVVAFYDNGVVPVQVILPVSEQSGKNYPKLATRTSIDEHVNARLQKLGIVPSELCSDVEFLRRVSLDMTGTLPLPDETLAFLADKSADKRAKKIDELLARPTYAAWWATRLSDWTGNAEATGTLGGERGLNGEKSKLWYQWLHRRIADNVPYDKLVEGIVLAVSQKPGQSFDDYCAEMSSYFRNDKPADFAVRDNMPFFWMRKTLGKPEAKALAFAHSFLGVSLQCAECHKHPYDQWTKQDFDQFAAFFNGIGYRDANRSRIAEMKAAVGLVGDQDAGGYARQFVKLAEAGKVLPFKELIIPPPAKKPRPVKAGAKGLAGRVITPRLLGGEEVLTNTYKDPRQPLMDWMRHADNPYFARAFVNRVWGNYFNVGLIDPADDLNLANPPSNPALLDYLTAGFIKSGYNMKWLHREIAISDAYQRSWKANDTNKHDERNYSHAVLRRLPAEVIYDALLHATASDDALRALHKNPLTTRAIGQNCGLSSKKGDASYALNLFGKPARTIQCDCERSSEPALLQTVYLRNDQDIAKMLDRSDGWLKQVAKTKMTPDELIRKAYLRTLSRLPNEREIGIARGYLSESANTASGLRDLMWALLNTKEFIVNR